MLDILSWDPVDLWTIAMLDILSWDPEQFEHLAQSTGVLLFGYLWQLLVKLVKDGLIGSNFLPIFPWTFWFYLFIYLFLYFLILVLVLSWLVDLVLVLPLFSNIHSLTIQLTSTYWKTKCTILVPLKTNIGRSNLDRKYLSLTATSWSFLFCRRFYWPRLRGHFVGLWDQLLFSIQRRIASSLSHFYLHLFHHWQKS